MASKLLLLLWPFVQNLKGVLTFPALMRPRQRHTGSGDGHVGRLARHVYVVLEIVQNVYDSSRSGGLQRRARGGPGARGGQRTLKTLKNLWKSIKIHS